MPALERRTMELVGCIEKRKMRGDRDNVIDLKEALSHWAFDFTVRKRTRHTSIMISGLNPPAAQYLCGIHSRWMLSLVVLKRCVSAMIG